MLLIVAFWHAKWDETAAEDTSEQGKHKTGYPRGRASFLTDNSMRASATVMASGID